MSPTHPVPSGHSWRRWRNTQGVSRRLWGIDARNAFLMIPSKTAAAYPVRWVCFFHRAKSAIDVWWVCELLKGYPGHWCRQCRRRRTKRGGAWRYFCTSFRSCCSKAAFLPRGTSNDVSQNLQDIWCFFFLPGFSMLRHENLHPSIWGIGQVLLSLASFLKFHNWFNFKTWIHGLCLGRVSQDLDFGLFLKVLSYCFSTWWTFETFLCWNFGPKGMVI